MDSIQASDVPTQDASDYLNSPHASWYFSQVYGQPRFAHHPVCECYENHLLRFGKVDFCLGCSCAYLGGIATALLLIYLWVTDSLPAYMLSCASAVGFGLVMFAPTLIQPIYQKKLFKIVSRTCLGVSVVVLCWSAAFLLSFDPIGFLLRIVFVFVFITTYKLTCIYRKEITANPKQKCGDGDYPFCVGNRRHLSHAYQALVKRAEPNDPLLPFAKKLSESDNGAFCLSNSPPPMND